MKQNPLRTLFNFLAVALAVVVLVGIGLTLLGLAGYSVAKGTDVIYSTGYMLGHWSDTKSFPADAEFCKGLYCRRTDTTEKHISGSPGKQSETFVHFCPEHQRSDYLVFLDMSHLGTLCWYAFGFFVLVTTALWFSLAAATVSGVVAGPAFLFSGQQARTKIGGLWFGASVLVGILLALPCCSLYVWW